MARFTVQVDKKSGITLIEFIGKISIGDVAKFMQTPEYANRTNRILYDCRNASFVDIPGEDILAGVRELKSMAVAGNKGAFVCNEGVDFGIANMFKNYSAVSEYPEPVGVFTSMDDALQWLNSDQG